MELPSFDERVLFYKVQFLFEKRKHFEFVLILKKIKLNANVNVNVSFDVICKKLDEKFKHLKNPIRIQIEKAGDFRSKWRTMFIHDLSGRKRGFFYPPFCRKEGVSPPFFVSCMTIMQILKSIIL